MSELTLKQRRFVIEYCVDENATQAAIRAGYSEDTARQIGSALLTKVDIQQAVADRFEQISLSAGATVDFVVSEWLKIATADPSELTWVEHTCCRYCYGTQHGYQWTEGEYLRAMDKAIERGQPAPEAGGGFGYDGRLPPAPECPECSGKGISEVRVADIRKLSGKAKLLYAGVKKTKDGIQILTRDQDAALANIARYLAMFVERKEVSGPGGGPVPVGLTVKAEDLSDEQLAAILAKHANGN